MTNSTTSAVRWGTRRGVTIDAVDLVAHGKAGIDEALPAFELFDEIYRSLCAILYNYVPGSGHPGGSISSGRIVQPLLFGGMDYDLADPDAPGADMISYSAGHKALGLYALWALRNEVARIGNPALVPKSESRQLRLEDLLGFRRNPTNDTPLFRELRARALDGHPTPATPFVRLATGASGVGVGSSFGLALGALDVYRDDPPRVHVIEGEGGLTPGRVAEAMAAAGTMGLRNLVLHVDWNQASIDSDRVCREDGVPGDYVQWNPAELAALHDWNVIFVQDGKDYRQIAAAQEHVVAIDNGQPTAIVYRTVKGWQYGIEGRASHGAGHKLCASGFYEAITPLLSKHAAPFPRCEKDETRCKGCDAEVIESCLWMALEAVRETLKKERGAVDALCTRLDGGRARLAGRNRRPSENAPRVEAIFELSDAAVAEAPADLRLAPGTTATLRGALGDALGHFNRLSNGAFLVSAADLVGSTSVNQAVRAFPSGFFHASSNPGSRLLSVGGICEDAMAALLSGLSAYGWHVGVGSSYAAFLAPLGHIAARLHAIGTHARQVQAPNEGAHPFVLVCAHAGLKTGEDGPTHADPQALQLFQENFAPGSMITLTPWEPQEIWPLLATAFRRRPAVIAPFVTRPSETVIDRAALGLAPPSAAVTGVYRLRAADPKRSRDGTIVLQESGVTYAFVEQALPGLLAEGFNLEVIYIASAELFDLLSPAERERVFPEALANEAMGITGFTLPTLYRWVTSRAGRARSMHPFQHGHYLGSGQGPAVLREAGLDGESQLRVIRRYVDERRAAR